MGLHDTRVVFWATYHGTSWDLANGTGTVDGKPGHEYRLQSYSSVAKNPVFNGQPSFSTKNFSIKLCLCWGAWSILQVILKSAEAHLIVLVLELEVLNLVLEPMTDGDTICRHTGASVKPISRASAPTVESHYSGPLKSVHLHIQDTYCGSKCCICMLRWRLPKWLINYS